MNRPVHRSLLLALVLALGIGGLGGCASYTEETREIRSLYRSEAYLEALSKLDKTDLKTQERNRLLYRLERAMILDRLGEGKKARTLLIEASKISDELYTTSVSKTAASFVFNDSATDYEGEDYEKVAIHTQLALSFLGDGDLQAATVEARKINNKLHQINQAYDEDNRNRYAEDAFARYLAGVIHEARGDWDAAIVDYGRALELYAGPFAEFVTGGVPDALVKSYWRLLKKRNRPDRLAKVEKDYAKIVEVAKAEDKATPDAGEIVVVHELGHIATKSTNEFVMSIGKQVVRFSFPVIRKRSYPDWRETGLQVSGGKLHRGENVANMDDIARATLEDRRLRMVAKQMTRLLAKGQLTEQAYRNFGPIGGIAANIYSAVSETADTRSWTLLPEGYFITRARLAPGTYTIELKTGGRVGQIKTIKVEPGKMVLLRDVG